MKINITFQLIKLEVLLIVIISIDDFHIRQSALKVVSNYKNPNWMWYVTL